jgi:hypothetical protein
MYPSIQHVTPLRRYLIVSEKVLIRFRIKGLMINGKLPDRYRAVFLCLKLTKKELPSEKDNSHH